MKENIFNKFANKLTKDGLLAIKITICMLATFFLIIGFVYIFSYGEPKNLQEATGIIAKFEQHDAQWYDQIDGGTGSYLKITFEDGVYFEATGICYDNIDRGLFDLVSIGDEIKITYNKSSTRPNRIYSIEYNGINYLALDDVLAIYKNESVTSQTTGAILISVSVVAGGVLLFIVNVNRKKSNQPN